MGLTARSYGEDCRHEDAQQGAFGYCGGGGAEGLALGTPSD
jgi:hypothetical protein